MSDIHIGIGQDMFHMADHVVFLSIDSTKINEGQQPAGEKYLSAYNLENTCHFTEVVEVGMVIEG